MGKYVLRENISNEAGENLKEYDELTSKLLFYRGIKTVEEARDFLNPHYENHTHDPFLMKGMEKAVERILKAIKNKAMPTGRQEKIIIFSDFDADGIPGAVALHDFFKKIGFKNFENYIPHRHEEGFGLNSEAVGEFAENGAKIIITIDCGIADVKEVAEANALGMEVIITDHHLPGEKLPEAYAILDPKQEDCRYPEKMLCGSGVIFKLIQALIIRGTKEKVFEIKEGWEKWLLDMVGLATLSDMVPLLGENRIFAYYGLKVLRKSPRVGIMKLLRKLKIDQKNLTEDDIGFMITPRINVASRLADPMDAFKLLSTKDESEADILSDHLNKINEDRKSLVAVLVKELKHEMTKRFGDEKPKVIVMGNPKWRPAVLGLAANSLMKEHNCPVFLWGREGDDALKGSCRSANGINLQELMRGTKEGTFTAFGGHAMSGGFEVAPDKIHLLQESLEEALSKLESGEILATDNFIDAKISLGDLSWEFYRNLEKMAPFGMGNSRPLFLFEKIEVMDARHFGKIKGHLELIFNKSGGEKVSAIGFFMGKDSAHIGENIKKGEKINLVASIEKSVFRNYPELRLRIVDIV